MEMCIRDSAYTIGMEPECVLYALEYMPEPVSDIDAWKNFIERQTFYKQSDLVIWCIPVEEQDKYLKVYPDCDVQILSLIHIYVRCHALFLGTLFQCHIVHFAPSQNILQFSRSNNTRQKT